MPQPDKVLYSIASSRLLFYPLDDSNFVLDPETYIVLNTVPTEDPPTEFNRDTQAIELRHNINLEENTYQAYWAVVDKPNWNGFVGEILADIDFNTAIGVAMTLAPAAALSLPTALGQVQDRGVDSFKIVWNTFCDAVEIDGSLLEHWGDMAVAHKLPEDFVNAILRIVPAVEE